MIPPNRESPEIDPISRLAAEFQQRLDSLRETQDFPRVWTTGFYWMKNTREFAGALWLPEPSIQRLITSTSEFEHFRLIVDTQWMLKEYGIDLNASITHGSMDITTEPPKLAIDGLLTIRNALREQVQQDFGVAIEHDH